MGGKEGRVGRKKGVKEGRRKGGRVREKQGRKEGRRRYKNIYLDRDREGKAIIRDEGGMRR